LPTLLFVALVGASCSLSKKWPLSAAIRPEYFYHGKQIVRAALKDHFCGKPLGLPMGVDVCYTNRA
jgi:hypothetical protein